MNTLVELVRQKCGIEGAPEYFGRVGTRKWRNGGCARMFESSRYAEMDWSLVRQNILIK